MKFFLTCGFLILAVFLCVSFQASAQARGTVNFTIVVSEYPDRLNPDADNTPVSSASVSVRPDGHNTEALPDYSAFETDIFSCQSAGTVDLPETETGEKGQYVVVMEFN